MLLVVGDVVTDIVAVPDTPLAAATDTAARIRRTPGGSGANTAAWAGHRGAAVTLLGRCGDEDAPWHTELLTRHGVRPVLRTDPVLPTATVIAVISPDGERAMITDRGAGAALGLADWSDDLLTGVRRVHLSGYLLFAGPGRELAGHVIASARSRNVPVSLDPASTGFIEAFGTDRFLAETAGVDLLMPNADEARLLSGESDAEKAAIALSARYRQVAVTLGRAGAVLAEAGRVVARQDATTVTVTDSVGAGDAFAGGYLAALAAGAAPGEAMAAGCEAAASAVTLVGGRPPAP
ncbi:sugar/nucleoside kinase (ribokinase family) [Stackebrandtia albiflava]|uniref:Sugar/nucleoside kinase (Ribokinase family) n=1 Tax=Stackebrandtia albiflava TaxID=406432 RepID=A0A562VA39_9ACTN|nr:PfkB family carbohydrate kinase [Stackebrandtia albiflava]TWJ14746.1 sugar/nucleoside kinase (ribokinase family) [Stackebrandtia albiflava]